MVLGLNLSTYTLVHVLISLAGIASGLVVVGGLLTNRRLDQWTAVFLATTAATSLSGFGFPVEHVLPSHIVGSISLVVLAVAIAARYKYQLSGASRWIYAVGAVMALYLNVFVLVIQSFLKISALKALAPTQTEPPFAVAQLIVLAVFIGLGVSAVKKFQKKPVVSARAASA
jgi:uncharacterized membrane protein YdcZ (DUF606 family)